MFASLAVANNSYLDATPLSMTIPAPGPGKIIVPIHIRAHSKIANGCRTSIGLSTLVSDMDEREISICRLDDQGAVITQSDTPLVTLSDYDRVFDTQLEVAAIRGVPELDNAALKLVFNGKDAAFERQYILCNYKIIEGE